MNEWFIALSESFKSAPKMDSSCRHNFCHVSNSSSTVNQPFVFTTACSTSPFFSLALSRKLKKKVLTTAARRLQPFCRGPWYPSLSAAHFVIMQCERQSCRYLVRGKGAYVTGGVLCKVSAAS